MRPTPDRKEAARASRRDERRLRRSFSRRRLPPLRPPARGVAHDVPRVARHDPRAARSQWSGEVHAPRDARDAAASILRQHSLRNARHSPRDQRLRARIGVLGHDLFLYPELTARENLAFFAGLYGIADTNAPRPCGAREGRPRHAQRGSGLEFLSRDAAARGTGARADSRPSARPAR